VARGENAGRTLHHIAVVRRIKEFNSDAADGRLLHLSGADFPLNGAGSTSVRLIVFQVDRKTKRVLAVAERTINR
jgi:hypothetical protein